MNDIFISYRRRGGEAWAAHIKDLLEKRGARCYLDKHKKRTTDFKEALYRNINQSNNFLLLLTEGVFDSREDEIDWVRDEIEYARSIDKNIIAVMFGGYDPNDVDLKSDERISFLKTFECLKFEDANKNLRNASVDTIIQYMVDGNGKPWKNSLKDNNLWYNDSISDEDRLWMTANMEVCKKMDKEAFDRIMKNEIFENKKTINFFTLMCYDVDSLALRTINYLDENNYDIQVNVYGFCHNYDYEYANELFGEGHFMIYEGEKKLDKSLKELIKTNKIKSFDVVDMILVLKDLQSPEKALRIVTEYLNSKGSALYIRDLDDDLVMAYPDDKNLIPRAIDLLSLDRGAGNRHFGKCIFTYLNRSGADEIFMSESGVSSANFGVKMKRKLCDAYFSYLKPEFEVLTEKNPENEDYLDGLNWLEMHYAEIESLFESKEFYFKSGYISGYGIYKDDKYFED